MRFIAEDKTTAGSALLPIVLLAAASAASLFQLVPTVVGWLAFLVVSAAVFLAYAKARYYSLSYFGLTLSSALFCVAGLLRGFDNVLPLTGVYFFSGFAAAFFVQGLWFHPANVKPLGRYLMLLLGLLYALGAGLAVYLFPAIEYVYVPLLVAVVPSITIFTIIPSLLTDHDNPPARPYLRIGTAATVAVGLAACALVGGLFFFKAGGDGQLNAEQKRRAAELESLAAAEPTDANLLEVGRYYFMAGDVDTAETWFAKTTPDEPISRAYGAAILGIRADRVPNPVDKARFAEQGIEKMEAVMRDHGDIHEIVYIRTAFYRELPEIFGKRQVVIDDLRRLLEEMPPDATFFPLAARALNEFAPEEIEKLRPAIREKAKAEL